MWYLKTGKAGAIRNSSNLYFRGSHDETDYRFW